MVTNIDNETKINFKAEMGDEDWLPDDDYIIKPIEPTEFKDKVDALLAK